MVSIQRTLAGAYTAGHTGTWLDRNATVGESQQATVAAAVGVAEGVVLPSTGLPLVAGEGAMVGVLAKVVVAAPQTTTMPRLALPQMLRKVG